MPEPSCLRREFMNDEGTPPIIREIMDALADLEGYLTRIQQRVINPHQARIVLKGKITLLDQVLTKFQHNMECPIMDKVDVYLNILHRLDPLVNEFPFHPLLEEAWMDLSTTANHVRGYLIEQALESPEINLIRGAQMLSQILMQDNPTSLPKVPSTVYNYRKRIVYLLNYLQSMTYLYEIAISSVPFFHEEDFLQWTERALIYRKLYEDIVEEIDWKKLYLDYTSTKEEDTLYSNLLYITNHLNSGINVFYNVQAIYGQSWPSLFQQYTSGKSGIEALWHFHAKNSRRIQKLEQIMEGNHDVLHPDPNFFKEDLPASILKELYQYHRITTFELSMYDELLNSSRKPEGKTIILDFLAYLEQQFRELINDKAVTDLTREFLSEHQGEIFLNFCEGYLEALFYYWVVTRDTTTFTSKLGFFFEFLDQVNPELYPQYMYILLLSYLVVHITDWPYLNLIEVVNYLTKIRNASKEHFTLFIAITILLVLIGYYAELFTPLEIETLLQSTIDEMKVIGVTTTYCNELHLYTSSIFALLQNEPVDLKRLDRLKYRYDANPFDIMSYLIPDLYLLTTDVTKVEIPYFPFNLEKDRLLRLSNHFKQEEKRNEYSKGSTRKETSRETCTFET